MEGVDHQRYWDEHASTDPLWAVLSFPDKRGRWSLPEFMKTGEREIALLFHRLAELHLPLPSTRALDFGCGVGRLTQALARRVANAVGADISPVMLEHARRLNRYPDRVTYVDTAATGLDAMPEASFDCVYSNIVLQHVPPEPSMRCIADFCRLLSPGGVLVFQLPSHRDSRPDAEITAMSDESYRAKIALTAPLPAIVTAGSTLNVMLSVRNDSTRTWSQPESGPLAVGNHWLDAGGQLMVTQDDGRAPLLQVVPPGFEWPVLMSVHAPVAPGRYVCEIDLVHEGISWFSGKGSPTVRFAIEVEAGDVTHQSSSATMMMKEYPVPDYPEGLLPTPPASLPPSSGDFPMHGVHRDQVIDVITDHGARLVYLEEDPRAGPEWVSYRYFCQAGGPTG
jgi:SAM-dependent methyltransferase